MGTGGRSDGAKKATGEESKRGTLPTWQHDRSHQNPNGRCELIVFGEAKQQLTEKWDNRNLESKNATRCAEE